MLLNYLRNDTSAEVQFIESLKRFISEGNTAISAIIRMILLKPIYLCLLFKKITFSCWNHRVTKLCNIELKITTFKNQCLTTQMYTLKWSSKWGRQTFAVTENREIILCIKKDIKIWQFSHQYFCRSDTQNVQQMINTLTTRPTVVGARLLSFTGVRNHEAEKADKTRTAEQLWSPCWSKLSTECTTIAQPLAWCAAASCFCKQ